MTSRKGIRRFALACIVISTGLAANGSVSGISIGATIQAGTPYTITVTDAPNSPVTISWNKNGSSYGTPNFYAGNTDGSGVFTLSGTTLASDIGDWYEYYYVNGVSTGTLQFMIRQTPGSGACSNIPWGDACIHGYSLGKLGKAGNWSGGSTYHGDANICYYPYTPCSPVISISTIFTLHDLGGGSNSDFEFVNPSGSYYVTMTLPAGFQPPYNIWTWDSPISQLVSTAPGKIYTVNFYSTCTAYGMAQSWAGCN